MADTHPPERHTMSNLNLSSYGQTFTANIAGPSDLAALNADHGIAFTRFDGRDIRFLPLMLEAARTAEAEDYCGQFDRISEAIGSFTRDELRNAGLLTSTFTVRGERTVTLTVRVPFTTSVECARPADIRNGDVELDIDVDDYEIRQAISEGNYEVDDTSDDIEDIERD